MTVQELINLLNSVGDKTLPVVITGYEGGLDDVIGSMQRPIFLNVNKEDYYGPHESVGGLVADAPGAVQALILRSTRNECKGE